MHPPGAKLSALAQLEGFTPGHCQSMGALQNQPMSSPLAVGALACCDACLLHSQDQMHSVQPVWAQALTPIHAGRESTREAPMLTA